MTQIPNLHREVVSGIVQVVKYLSEQNNKGIKSIGFGELMNAGRSGRTPEAQTYILEFVKDGIGSLQKKHIDDVVNGNYEVIWDTVNRYLKFRGYTLVEPEPIDV